MWSEVLESRSISDLPATPGTLLPAGFRARDEIHPDPLAGKRGGPAADIVATPLPLAHAAPSARITRSVLGGLVAIGDGAILALAACLWAAAAVGTVWLPVLAGLGVLFVALAGGQYGARGLPASSTVLWGAWCLASIGALVILGVVRADVQDWGGFVAWAAGSTAGLFAWRNWLSSRTQAWREAGGLVTRMAVVGSAGAEPLLSAIARGGAPCGVELVGRHATDAPPDQATWQALRQQAADGRLDGVVVALPWSQPEQVAQACAALRCLPVDVWLVPDPHSPAALGAWPTLVPGASLLPVALRPLADWQGVCKRAEDLVLGTLLLLAFSPVMLLAVMAVALDSRGPVLLRQRRFGYGNAPFMVYKFRTMYHDRGDVSGMRPTVPGDPRVTRVGRFLRSHSIDELPQFFNVLKGEMSLVGPRPHPVEMRVLGHHYHDAVPRYPERHRMKPGITGLAQINGYRGLVDTAAKAQGRLAWDLAYIENWSVGLDLRILWRTVFRGFFGSGAF